MQKVKFKRFIPIEWEIKEGERGNSRVEGSGRFESEFNHEGLFHRWGSNYEEFENGAGNYTIAIVQLNDGTIEEVLPTNLKFI